MLCCVRSVIHRQSAMKTYLRCAASNTSAFDVFGWIQTLNPIKGLLNKHHTSVSVELSKRFALIAPLLTGNQLNMTDMLHTAQAANYLKRNAFTLISTDLFVRSLTRFKIDTNFQLTIYKYHFTFNFSIILASWFDEDTTRKIFNPKQN